MASATTLSSNPNAPELSGAPSPGPFPSPRLLFLLLLAYFGSQVILRVTFSTSVDLDESEQVVLGQKLCLGYGSDPPLYTWIQSPFFRLFGESVLALSLLKNLLLLGNCSLMFAIAKGITRTPAAAAAAALSLFFIPSVAWESQRDLTHSVLSVTLALATLFCFVHLHRQRRTSWYVALGFCVGLGAISKYNYVFWPLGLFLGALSLAEFRPAIRDRRMLLTLAIAILLALPNLLWVLNHCDLALLTSGKFEIQPAEGWLHGVVKGLRNLVQSLFSFSAPLVLIYFLIFLPRSDQPTEPVRSTAPYAKLLVRVWLIIGTCLLALILFARTTNFRERWFQPLLIFLPVMAALVVQRRLTASRLKWLSAGAFTVMLAVAVIMPGRLLLAERLHREEPLTRPYARLAAEMSPRVPPGSLVVCNTRLLAGNLRLGLPQATLLSPELTLLLRENQPHCFLAWEPERRNQPWEELTTPPRILRNWVTNFASGTFGAHQPQFFSATYKFHQTKRYHLGLLQLY